jgi:hypothetical protein
MTTIIDFVITCFDRKKKNIKSQFILPEKLNFKLVEIQKGLPFEDLFVEKNIKV